MKTTIQLYLILFATLFAVCSSCTQPKSDLAYIDTTQNYPEKDILLTDIADIDYLYLNSDDDDYLYNGTICCITKTTIIVYDYTAGNILFFAKNGTPKSRFNRKGQGPEEYVNARSVFYDEATDDVFVYTMNYINVYSSTGQYKRKITLPQDMIIGSIMSFDEQSFIFYDLGVEAKRFSGELDPGADNTNYFYRISKTNGEVLDAIEVPYVPLFLGINLGGQRIPGRTKRLVESPEGVLLCSPETDTIFLYSHDRTLTPVLYKTPSVNATDPMKYLNNCLDRGQFQFIEVYTVRAGDKAPGNFPATYYMRNKNTGEVIRPTFSLPDYKGKEFAIIPGSVYDDGYLFELDLIELKQAYDENKLSGKLKELVATLNEEKGNNVFILLHFK